jgi:uncharacterized lipoprotein YajG
MSKSKRGESIMNKRILFVAIAAVLLIGGCTNPTSTSLVTTAQATTAAQAPVNGMMTVMNSSSSWTVTRNGSSATASYSNAGINMTGTLTGIGSNPAIFTLNIAFFNYVDTTGYTVNGTVNMSMTVNTLTTAISGTITGNLTLSGGPVATEAFNITFTGTGGSASPNMTFAGTITCNGTAFGASTLGIQTSGSSALHVYIGGAVGPSIASGVPVYWKDGVLNFLAPDGASGGGAYGIAEDKSGNLYIAGVLDGQPGYWKNSTFTALSLGTYAQGYASSIAVDTNGNVWVGGQAGTPTPNIFVYWENSGNCNVLPGSPNDAWGLQADTFGNVYFIGTELIGGNPWPCYWKNGANPTALTLTGGNNGGYAAQLAVDSSGNLYICGMQWGGANGGPVYWKTVAGIWQSATLLPQGAYSGNGWWNVSGIVIDFTGEIYMAGGTGISSLTTPIYWKGLTSTPTTMTLPTGTSVFGLASGAAAFDGSGNFIVAGTAGNTQSGIADSVPFYWQNGTPINLPMGSGNAWGMTGWVVAGP